MALSLNFKDAGDPICTHTMYDETEEELMENAETWYNSSRLYGRFFQRRSSKEFRIIQICSFNRHLLKFI